MKFEGLREPETIPSFMASSPELHSGHGNAIRPYAGSVRFCRATETIVLHQQRNVWNQQLRPAMVELGPAAAA